MANLTKQQVVELLKGHVEQAETLKQGRRFSPEFKQWRRNVEVDIVNIFGEGSRQYRAFTTVSYTGRFSYHTESEYEQALNGLYRNGLDEAHAVLQSMVREVERFWPDTDAVGTAPAVPGRNDSKPATQDVFIVHGHDDGLKAMVARFLSDLGLNPIILHEQPNQGRTIIDKFKDYASVAGFAVALFTPDDLGEAKDKVTTVEALRPRARQNVIFELGFFVGKLPRGNAVALVKGNVELPSDLAGVLYIPVDNAGGWRLDLIRELKAGGFDVDANLALKLPGPYPGPLGQ